MSPERCAVIFDWNGTLLADTALMARATNETLKLLGVKPVSLALYRAHYTVPILTMYKDFGCKEAEIEGRRDEIFQIFGQHYEAGVKKVRLRKGGRELLQTLKRAGHKLAVLSNYTVERITPLAEKHGLLRHFDAIMANRETYVGAFRRASKGERLKAFIEANTTRRGLVVGDTVEEIDIARAYGFLSVVIEGGACTSARLRAARPDFMVQNLSAIAPIAREVFGGAR